MGLMDEDYIWITLDGITTRPETISYGDKSYLSYYQGIFGTAPHYGKDSSVYNVLKDAYIMQSRGPSSDLTMSPTKVSEGLQILHSSLVRLGSIERETLKDVECGKSDTWAAGPALFSDMSSIADVKYFQTYEIMNFKTNGFERVGFWKYDTGLVDSSGEDVSWRSRNDLSFMGNVVKAPSGIGSNLNGYHLRVGVLESPPTSYLVNSSECQNDSSHPSCWIGWTPDIVARLAEDLNFTYEYVVAPDRTFGIFNRETNSWGRSIVGEIVNRNIDLSVALAVTSERAKYIDFSSPFYEDSASMVMYPAVGSSEPSSNLWFFLEPFEMSVWGALIILIVFVATLTNFFSKFSPFGSFGEKINAMQHCPCKQCASRRRVKKAKKCRFVDTKKFECLLGKVEEDDDMNDLSFYNSTWLIGTGKVEYMDLNNA